jgi:hypothetical protein
MAIIKTDMTIMSFRMFPKGCGTLHLGSSLHRYGHFSSTSFPSSAFYWPKTKKLLPGDF